MCSLQQLDNGSMSVIITDQTNSTNTDPDPGMPTLCITQTQNWKKKTKKNTKKLNELSLLQPTHTHISKLQQQLR